jgi:hypothetical protein
MTWYVMGKKTSGHHPVLLPEKIMANGRQDQKASSSTFVLLALRTLCLFNIFQWSLDANLVCIPIIIVFIEVKYNSDCYSNNIVTQMKHEEY